MLGNSRLDEWIDRIDTELVRYFAEKDMQFNPLERAMEYTLLAGGKRLRPLLTLVVVHEFGGDVAAALPLSLASELMHTYSLIHDDLPCMDDDDMRRGKPANHVIFGEANAILAGDALHSEAFLILATALHPGLTPQRRLNAIAELAQAVGRSGMVAGQVMDLAMEGTPVDLDRLTRLHRCKTGALLRFCVRLGGHLAALDDTAMAALTRYAEALGLLFQVVDDLLDNESDSHVLGKTAGKDAIKEKATFPALLGAHEAHRFADGLLQEALATLESLPIEGALLAEIANYVRARHH